MVRREIQPDANRRTKSLNGLELERAHFDREQVQVAIFERDFAKRLSDVAAGDRALPAGIEHLRQQFGSGRLAVGAGDRDDGHVDGTPAQFQLAHNLDLPRGKILGQGRVRIDARAQDDEIIISRIPFGLRAAIHRDAARAQIFDRRFQQRFFPRAVEDGYLGAFAAQQQGRRCSA
jgi:hypothetical protein